MVKEELFGFLGFFFGMEGGFFGEGNLFFFSYFSGGRRQGGKLRKQEVVIFFTKHFGNTFNVEVNSFSSIVRNMPFSRFTVCCGGGKSYQMISILSLILLIY